MKILLAASELAPLAYAGQIGEGVAGLASGLKALGHEVSVVLPRYRLGAEGGKPKRTGVKFSVPVGASRYPCEVYETRVAGVQVFLVARDEFFDRTGLYGNENGDYQDNAARYIFFTKAALELARRMDPSPDIIHANGWQTALAGVFVREYGLPFRTVLTPYGLEFQGNFWSYDFGLTNLPGHYFSAGGLEFYGSMNFLKAGILFSDAVVMPDERAVAAAKTPAFGCGLEQILREQARKIWGIADGAATRGWDPSEDSGLASAFGPKNPAARAANWPAAERLFAWSPGDAGRRDLVVFSEASDGLGIFFDALDRILAHGARVGGLGPVPADCRKAFEIARRKYAGRLGWKESFTERDARDAMAGCEFLVVPGGTDPRSGWLQRGLRYGLVPVAMQCDGIGQFVKERRGGHGNGFLFFHATADALADACRKAMGCADIAAASAASLALEVSARAAVDAHVELYARLAPGEA